MIEKLTEQDRENIVSWIANFGPQNNGKAPYNAPTAAMADLDYILRFWDQEKGKNLSKLFGDNLILSRPYTYNMPTGEIYRTICRKVRPLNSFMRISQFLEDAVRKVATLNEIRYGLSELVDSYTLAEGTCERVFTSLYSDAASLSINLPNGKVYKIQRKTKPIKVLYKLMETWGERLHYDEALWRQDYETVRIALSQCTNTAALHGDLCLSIHPLDFMTMSDNDNNWSSCMRWRHNGEYSQGTIEMMNSPTVIVAYLHNPEKPMGLPNGNTWNNKIWRELFVVSDKIVTEVKSYPYDDRNISKSCLDWIMSLMGEELGWEFREMEGDCADINIGEDYETEDGEKYDRPIAIHANFSFRNNYMYSDFGTLGRNHYTYVNIPRTMKKYKPGYGIYWEVEYSGISECVWCGGTCLTCDNWDDGEETSGCRICDDCTDATRCTCCGERIRGDNYYYDADGNIICCNCYDEYYCTDDITGEIVHNDYIMTIYLAKGNDETNPDFTGDEIHVVDQKTPYWSEYFKIPHSEIRTYRRRCWYTRYYVFVSDCTEKGLGLFNYYED